MASLGSTKDWPSLVSMTSRYRLSVIGIKCNLSSLNMRNLFDMLSPTLEVIDAAAEVPFLEGRAEMAMESINYLGSEGEKESERLSE